MGIVDVASLAVLAYVGFRLVDTARVAFKSRAHVLRLWRGLRWRHFLLAVPTFGAVIGVAAVLLSVPGLDFGWWTWLGGEGNPVFGAAPEGSTGPLESLLPVVFVGLLLLGLPLLVEGEEWVFRRGAEKRGRLANLRWAMGFGLVHAAIGIPIGVAMALSVGGIYFTLSYLWAWRRTGSPEAALTESTRAHLGYNLSIVVLVVVGLTTGLFDEGGTGTGPPQTPSTSTTGAPGTTARSGYTNPSTDTIVTMRATAPTKSTDEVTMGIP